MQCYATVLTCFTSSPSLEAAISRILPSTTAEISSGVSTLRSPRYVTADEPYNTAHVRPALMMRGCGVQQLVAQAAAHCQNHSTRQGRYVWCRTFNGRLVAAAGDDLEGEVLAVCLDRGVCRHDRQCRAARIGKLVARATPNSTNCIVEGKCSLFVLKIRTARSSHPDTRKQGQRVQCVCLAWQGRLEALAGGQLVCFGMHPPT